MKIVMEYNVEYVSDELTDEEIIGIVNDHALPAALIYNEDDAILLRSWTTEIIR